MLGRRSRPATVALCAAAICAACSTSSPGHGTGAGAVPQTSSAPSTPLTSSSSTPPSTPSSKPTSKPSPKPSSKPTAKPTSTQPAATDGSYTGRGNPNTWCGSSQLAVTGHEPPGGGAAGHTGVELQFLNNSHSQCILYGYPGADGINGGGKSIAHAKRTLTGYLGGCHCSQLRGVLIKPGQSAYALVEGDIGGHGNCDSFRGLLVTPPNTYGPSPIQLTPHSCDFEIHPVTPNPS